MGLVTFYACYQDLVTNVGHSVSDLTFLKFWTKVPYYEIRHWCENNLLRGRFFHLDKRSEIWSME